MLKIFSMMQRQLVIAGASSGIGLEIARKAVQNGQSVTAFSRNRGMLAEEPSVSWHQKNLTEETIQREELPEIIDSVVYCPGSIVLKPFRSLSTAQFSEDYAINVIGAVNVIKSCMDGLKKSSSQPSILLFSTVAVSQGMPYHASIAAAKGAVEGLVKSLAAEFAPLIRVNCIAPSLTDTPLAGRLLSGDDKKEAAAQRHPLKKIGNPSEIAALAHFLLSEEASWITGQVIHADGGMSSIRI